MIVVSDSHLSARTPEATAHWDALVDHVTATGPDLVVHVGDISTDGEVVPDDLDYSRRQLDRVPAPLVAVPGNHDVGDGAAWTYDGAAAIGADTLRPYRATFGPDRFSVPAGRWRLLGLDAQLLGSGEPEEDDQWAWLDDEIRRVPPATPVGLVLHKPLVPVDGDRDRPGRYVPEPARGRLLALLAGVDSRVVVSGHVHQALRRDRDGLTHVWVPSSLGGACPTASRRRSAPSGWGRPGSPCTTTGASRWTTSACPASTTSSSAWTWRRRTASCRRSTERSCGSDRVAMAGEAHRLRRLLDGEHDEELGHRHPGDGGAAGGAVVVADRQPQHDGQRAEADGGRP